MRSVLWLLAGLSVSVPSAVAEPIVVQQTAPRPSTVGQISDAVTAARLAREGQRLSAEQVKALEVRLEITPDDLPARARLLGYYFATAIKVAGPEATRAARRRHILCQIARLGFGQDRLEEQCGDVAVQQPVPILVRRTFHRRWDVA